MLWLPWPRLVLVTGLSTAEAKSAPLHFRYQPPNLAISTLYWKAWPLLLVVAAFNPENIGEPPLASTCSSQLEITASRWGVWLIGTWSRAWLGPGR